jgi:hypothetical protein
MAKTAMGQLEDQVELIRREAYEAGYAAADPRDRISPGPSREPAYSGGTGAARATASPTTAGAARDAGASGTRRPQARSKTPRTRVECEVCRGSAASVRAAGGPPRRDPRRPAARQERVIGLRVDPPCAWTVGRPQSG